METSTRPVLVAMVTVTLIIFLSFSFDHPNFQCILFNDLLVFALGDSRQSTVELQLPLEALWVEDLEDRDPQTSVWQKSTDLF